MNEEEKEFICSCLFSVLRFKLLSVVYLLIICGVVRVRLVKIMSLVVVVSMFCCEIRFIVVDICELVKWDVVVEVGEMVGLGWRKRVFGFSLCVMCGILGVIGWRGYCGVFFRCSECWVELFWK